MSYTTTVILFFDVQENFEPDLSDRINRPVVQINNWLSTNYQNTLVPLSEALKDLSSGAENVWIGLFNFLDTDALLQVVRQQDWRIKNSVEVIFKGEEDERVSLFDCKT
jgi:hypothetical protein